MSKFVSSREDGRTRADVLYDLVFGKDAGTILAYDAIIAVLDEGSDHAHTRQEVCHAVARVNKRLLGSSKRTLRVVPGVGYRVAKASEHAEIASWHKQSGDRKYEKAMSTIRNTRLEEMTAAERNRHDAFVTIMEAHDIKLGGHEKRLRDLEETIRRMFGTSAAGPG